MIDCGICPDCFTPFAASGESMRERYWTSYGTSTCEDGIERWFGVRNDGATFVSLSKADFDAYLSHHCSCSVHNRDRSLCLVHSKIQQPVGERKATLVYG